MDYSALAEQVRGLGAYKAGVVDLQDVRFDRAFRAMCETNACGTVSYTHLPRNKAHAHK